MRPESFAAAALTLTVCLPALAQPTNISPSNKWSWSENCGWMNWRDAGTPVGSEGARIGTTRLSGYIWGENIGWVHLGDNAPSSGVHYANIDGGDYGVNIENGTGNLFGFAWGENVGWINFDTAAALGPFGDQARYDSAASRLRGYAWGENIGWINLDDDTHFVGTGCPADFNGDGTRDVPDIFSFLSAWFAMDPRADFDGNGSIAVPDIFAFLSAWFAGCA